jgi:hypothetical protein
MTAKENPKAQDNKADPKANDKAGQKPKPGDDDDDENAITFSREQIDEKEIVLAADTLVGDLRDALLGRVRNMQKPWEQMTEAQQRDVVEQITNAVKTLVTSAVKVIAANGRRTIMAKLGKIELDANMIKARIETKKTDETLLELSAAQALTILIIAADSSEFTGETAPAEIDPDQPDLENNINRAASGAKSTGKAA